MVQSVALLLVVLMVSMQATAWAAVQVIGFSPSSQQAACSLPSANALVFVFDRFSFASFSKAVGAYSANDNDACVDESCPFYSVKQEHHACQFEVLSLPTTFSQDTESSGVRVIKMDKPMEELSRSEAQQINQAIKAAKKTQTSVYVTEIPQSTRRILAADTVKYVPLRMMPELFMGLFLVISCSLALIVFFCCCMDGINTQIKFAKQYPQKGKEQN